MEGFFRRRDAEKTLVLSLRFSLRLCVEKIFHRAIRRLNRTNAVDARSPFLYYLNVYSMMEEPRPCRE
jgi:hypothetical protein